MTTSQRVAGFVAGMALAGAGFAFAGSDYYPPESLLLDDKGQVVMPGTTGIFRTVPTDCIPATRPPVEVTQRIKRQMLRDSGLPMSKMRAYELDAVVPRCLGGLHEPSNLQLEPWPEARKKDELEAKMCAAVKLGQVTCREARVFFTSGAWRGAIR